MNRAAMFRLNKHSSRQKFLGLECLESRDLMTADMVITWNNHLIDAIRSDSTRPGPTWASRNGAIVQAAVYDAVNGIQQTHTPFASLATAPATASAEAAVAVAAHDTLAALYPAQQAKFDAELVASLATIPDGPSEDAGVSLGHQVAADILALRAADGSAQGNPAYTPSTLPGHWRPDPSLAATQNALGAAWGSVTPFGIKKPYGKERREIGGF